MNNRLFYIEANEITEQDFNLIHRYLIKRLGKVNNDLVIKSIPLNTNLETFIKNLGV